LSDTTLTWLGHSTFLLRTDGKDVLIDPWVASNPACPEYLKGFDKIDAMLITHGHFDHIADAVPLAKQHRPMVVAIFELGEWLGRKGVENIESMNKGGTISVVGLEITMVGAEHSCGITDDDGSIVYGGEACGFIIKVPGGPTIYHAGDTSVFGDMALIAELYQPDIALLPIGDRYTMGPFEAAKALELLGVPRMIPMHFGTFPALTGTPEALRALAGDKTEIIELSPGETYPV